MTRPVIYAPKRPLLYVAGPMTQGGDHFRNVGIGLAAGVFAYRLGWAPIVPHYDAFTQLAMGFSGDLPISYEEWLALDFRYIEASDAVLVLPGVLPGSGTYRECLYADQIGRPRYTEDTLPEVHFQTI